jgi:hypothetical protein
LRDTLPDWVSLRDLGAHRPKDFDQPQRVSQLVIDDVRSDFPPLRTLEIPTSLRHPSRGQVHDIEALGGTAVLLPDEDTTFGIGRPRGAKSATQGSPHWVT